MHKNGNGIQNIQFNNTCKFSFLLILFLILYAWKLNIIETGTNTLIIILMFYGLRMFEVRIGDCVQNPMQVVWNLWARWRYERWMLNNSYKLYELNYFVCSSPWFALKFRIQIDISQVWMLNVLCGFNKRNKLHLSIQFSVCT